MLSDLRKHPRYFLPAGMAGKVGSVDVNVVDLSLHGARVQLAQPLSVGATLPFVLESSDGSIRIDATVRWCQLAAFALDDAVSDVFLAGVSFGEASADVTDLLDALIAAGAAVPIVDGRATERYHVMFPLTATFGEGSLAWIIDLSIRGARLSLPEPVEVGETRTLSFEVPAGPSVAVSGVVVWCRHADDKSGYDAGVRIEGEEAVLRTVIAQLCIRKQARVDAKSLQRKFDPLRPPYPLAS
jgi:hypothetical protein